MILTIGDEPPWRATITVRKLQSHVQSLASGAGKKGWKFRKGRKDRGKAREGMCFLDALRKHIEDSYI